MVVKAVKIPYGVGETELVILKKIAIEPQEYKGERRELFTFFMISIIENKKYIYYNNKVLCNNGT